MAQPEWIVDVRVAGQLDEATFDRLADDYGLGSAALLEVSGNTSLSFCWSCGCPECPPPPRTAAGALSRAEGALRAIGLERASPFEVYDGNEGST